MTEDEKAIEIGRILTEWNPLGDAAETVKDLNNYETEAFDILEAMDLFGDTLEKAVAEVLGQAFYIELESSELGGCCEKIRAVLGN